MDSSRSEKPIHVANSREVHYSLPMRHMDRAVIDQWFEEEGDCLVGRSDWWITKQHQDADDGAYVQTLRARYRSVWDKEEAWDLRERENLFTRMYAINFARDTARSKHMLARIRLYERGFRHRLTAAREHLQRRAQKYAVVIEQLPPVFVREVDESVDAAKEVAKQVTL